MRNEEDTYHTMCWAQRIITDPYAIIQLFFEKETAYQYCKDIKKILLCTRKGKVYHKRCPQLSLDMFAALHSLLLATHAISKERKASSCYHIKEEMFHPSQYAENKSIESAWDYFPRSLSKREYIQPYLVFTRFFKYRKHSDWQLHLQQVLTYANVNNFENKDLNLLQTYLYLTKLLQAAYLVLVREITHKPLPG